MRMGGFWGIRKYIWERWAYHGVKEMILLGPWRYRHDITVFFYVLGVLGDRGGKVRLYKMIIVSCSRFRCFHRDTSVQIHFACNEYWA
jgi:hypothetical protein